MIQSMTGYGKADVELKDLSGGIEIRSVNHKFLDTKIKLPKEFQLFEEKIKNEIKKFINRGKVDVTITVSEQSLGKRNLSLDQEMLRETTLLISEVEDKLGKDLKITLTDLLKIPGLITVKEEQTPEANWEKLFLLAVQKGVAALISSRELEGNLIKKDLEKHLENCKNLIKEVTVYQNEVVGSYKNRLMKNIEQLELKYNQDDPRILQEIGITIDRCDITEEINRFGAHLIHFGELLQGNSPIGRKMDFLLQEFNREANTLCSKANHSKINAIGVELKCEIEKMREQSLNIE